MESHGKSECALFKTKTPWRRCEDPLGARELLGQNRTQSGTGPFVCQGFLCQGHGRQRGGKATRWFLWEPEKRRDCQTRLFYWKVDHILQSSPFLFLVCFKVEIARRRVFYPWFPPAHQIPGLSLRLHGAVPRAWAVCCLLSSIQTLV